MCVKSAWSGGGVGKVGLGWVGVGSNNNIIQFQQLPGNVYGALQGHSTSFSLTPLSGQSGVCPKQ